MIKKRAKRTRLAKKIEGKKPYCVYLTKETIERVREREGNLSGLIDELLTLWLDMN